MGASSALMLLFADRIFRKYDVRAVLCLSEFLYALSLALRAVCTQYWQFALVHVLTGSYVFEYTLFGVLTFEALFRALAIIGKKGNTK